MPDALLEPIGSAEVGPARYVDIRVHDSTADMRYMILPMRPAGTEDMSEEELAGLVTRDSVIGVTVPRVG